MSVPSILIVPDVGFKNPVIIRIVVVFPAPFGPSRPTICPVGIEKLTSFTALNVPKMRETLLTSIINPPVKSQLESRLQIQLPELSA